MLSPERIRRLKFVLVLLVLGGAAVGGLNYQYYSEARQKEYRWSNDRDDSELSYRPSQDVARLVVGERFAPGPKVWKTSTGLPATGRWNTLVSDRLLRVPGPEDLLPRAQIQVVGSNVRGLAMLAFQQPPDVHLSPAAMDAIIDLYERGNESALELLDGLLKEGPPWVKLAVIKGLARHAQASFATDEEYRAWYERHRQQAHWERIRKLQK